MIKYDRFSGYYTETELPMITVNSLNEIVDYNEKSIFKVGRADIGLEVELRPLVNSKQKSFPYTAVLVLKDVEYLACVCLASPKSDEYRHIYFSDTANDTADALLASRFIIEQKYTELHSRNRFASESDQPFKKLQRLTMLSCTDTCEQAQNISLEQIVEYTVNSYKKRFPDTVGKTVEFSCEAQSIQVNENITSLTVALAVLSMALAKDEAVFTVKETPTHYVFLLILKHRRFMGDISSCGFSGMFLSRISCLNYWNTELAYNALQNETSIKIFVPKSNTSHRFSAETYHFDIREYTKLLADAFTM